MDRRKVLIYLHPDISTSERSAGAKIKVHHHGDRGDTSRTALPAELALGEVDSHPPPTLAALLVEDTKPETLRKILALFLEIQPASSAPAVASAAAPTKTPEPPALVSESVSARNLAGSLPDQALFPVRTIWETPWFVLRLVGLLLVLPGSSDKAERRDPGDSA